MLLFEGSSVTIVSPYDHIILLFVGVGSNRTNGALQQFCRSGSVDKQGV